MYKQAFLIATHILSPDVFRLYEVIRHATAACGPPVILYHDKTGTMHGETRGMRVHSFTDSILYDRGYIPLNDTLIPGNNHFPLLDFFLTNPPFEYYWYIEDDVAFSGEWTHFFESFRELHIDFISSCMRSYKDYPDWHWWDTFYHRSGTVTTEARIRSFNPVYRISFQALAFIHRCLSDQWQGHHEVLIPSLLTSHHFRIMDFGGAGPFVPPGFKNKFYTAETYRWRPAFTEPGDVKDKLYHPIKQNSPILRGESERLP